IRHVDGRMIVLSDTGFHAAEGDPTNLKLCQRGEWQDRMLVETVLSMLTLVCHLKKVMHRVADPRPADKDLGPPESPLSGVNQPVISTRNAFSTPRLTPLACVCAHRSRFLPRSSRGAVA